MESGLLNAKGRKHVRLFYGTKSKGGLSKGQGSLQPAAGSLSIFPSRLLALTAVFVMFWQSRLPFKS